MDTTGPTRSTASPGPDAGRLLRTITFQPRADEAWKRFTRELCLATGALEEDEYLIVLVKRSNCFVQFAAQGSFGMRVEATSNFYLPQEQSLQEPDHALLLEMGWCAPTNLPDQFEPAGQHPPDGSPNYFLDVAAPVPHDALAMLAVDTFTGVFGASHPLDLEYTAFSEGGTSIRFPTLGIRRQEART